MSIGEVAVIGLLGGLVALDTTAAWQVMFSQPLIACSLIGAVFQDITTGVFVGIIMECLWLNQIPLGGALVPLGTVGSFIAAGIAVQQPLVPFSSPWYYMIFLVCIYGIGIAHVGGRFVLLNRQVNQVFAHRALHDLEHDAVSRMMRWHYLSIAGTFVGGFFGSMVGVIVGMYLVRAAMTHTSTLVTASLGPVVFAIMGMGVGAAVVLFWRRTPTSVLLTGLGAGLAYIFTRVAA